LEKIKDSEVSDKERIAEEIAIGAIKYSILKHAPGGDIIFDFDTSLSFEGDSGPYLQYTYARAKSVLRRAEEEGLKARDVGIRNNVGELPRLLHRFPEIVLRAREEYAPQIVVTYLTELARGFNNFYARERIVEKGDEATWKLALTEATAQILKSGLYILGIKAPEKM